MKAACVAMLLAASAPSATEHGGAEAHTTTVRAGTAGADVPLAPEEGGPRRWRVTADDGLRLHDTPSADAAVIEVFAEGTILSNFGCARSEGVVWCEAGPFRGGRRGFAAAERLAPARGPDGSVPHGADDSASRARRKDFDARGRIPCAQERGQAMGECDAAVARGGGGDASVVVTFANGFARTLFFVHGEFVSADATMSGSGTDTEHEIEDGLHAIRVDDQRYELSDALVFGD